MILLSNDGSGEVLWTASARAKLQEVQTYLGCDMGSVPDHHNKKSTIIKQDEIVMWWTVLPQLEKSTSVKHNTVDAVR